MKNKIQVTLGDITQFDGDCIVNAANSSLCGGGGVDGAIHRVAGPKLLAECRTLKRCAPGNVKITDGYNLKAKKIIHAVGPVWQGGDHKEEELLRDCYMKSLDLCRDYELRSIAFPNISCGAYRFPYELACRLAFTTINDWLRTNQDRVDLAVIYCFEEKLFRIMSKVIETKDEEK